MELIPQSFFSDKPSTLTILTTYRCNAACAECCFESNPSIKGRLTYKQIETQIKDARDSFEGLKVVVFSGGECFLLKNDLYKSITLASNLGLQTRCVTNGFWGKTKVNADRTVKELIKADLKEINFSTGLDHQKWVPVSSIYNAIESLLSTNITIVVTIEKDTNKSNCYREFLSNSIVQEGLKTGQVSLQSNSWMPFKEGFEKREGDIKQDDLEQPCTQIFTNSVVTPHNMLSACCGLTLEHIPEMKIGDLQKKSIETSYNSQKDDFLKYWIHTDGPYTILRKVMGKEYVEKNYPKMRHICQACVYLHKDKNVRKNIQANYKRFIPEVLFKMSLKENLTIGINKDKA